MSLTSDSRQDGSKMLLSGPPPPSSDHKQRRVAIIAGVVAALLVGAVAVFFLVLNKESAAKSTGAYQTKLTAALTPVVNDNQALSKALRAVDGSPTTLRAATNATQTAQQDTVAARGAVAALVVPSGNQTLNQQATQALTQEAGYLQAVGSTLKDATSSSAGSLQSLASTTNAAFVPLNGVASGGSTSVYGVDNLLSWVSGTQAAAKRNEKPNVIIQNNNTTTRVPVPQPAPQPQPSGSSYGPYPLVSFTGSLNVRDAASTSANSLGAVDPGASVTIDCTASGEAIHGNTTWDHIVSPYVGYVADYYVNTGTSSPVAPSCDY